MLSAMAWTVGAVAWSGVANLGLGDRGYVWRNLALTAGAVSVAGLSGFDAAALGLAPGRLPAGLAWGSGLAVLIVAVVTLGSAAASRVRLLRALLHDRRAALPGPQLRSAVLVRIPVGTALFEEVLFRGVLLAVLLSVTSTGWALAWSILAFGLWHVAPTLVALRDNGASLAPSRTALVVAGAVLATTIGGALFAGLRLVTGSVLAPLLVHWATNAAGLLAAAHRQARTGHRQPAPLPAVGLSRGTSASRRPA